MLGPDNQSITGVFLGAEILNPRTYAMIAGLVDDVAAGRLEVIVDRLFPLSDAAEAHAYIESRQAVGRVVLHPLRGLAPGLGAVCTLAPGGPHVAE